MLPLLRYGADGEEHAFRAAVEHLASAFDLTEAERKHQLPSGRARTFYNRVGWACTYLKKAGLFETPKRAYFQITERGMGLLAEQPSELNARLLKRFDGFLEFQAGRRTPDAADAVSDNLQTPEETIEGAYQKMRDELADELLSSIRDCSPSFFETLVVELLVKMGYGGTLKDAGQAIGQSGDDGIDGIIKEDRLGLDVVYVQAKRWDPSRTVGRPDIQKFAGALQGHRARKGVFIATCGFSREAAEYVDRIETKIVLVDGALLTHLMMDYGIGVSPVVSYQIQRLDADYFVEN